MLDYLKVFLVGGLLCVIGEALILKTKLTPARILVVYITAGVAISAAGLYTPLVRFASAGATVPLTGFGHALAQGAGGCFDTHGVAVFGMAGGLAAPLAELLEVVHRQAVAGQMQQAVDEGAGMAAGQDEPIPVGPGGILGVMLHGVHPHGVSHGRHAHGRAGVAAVSLLHGVRRQGADVVDGQLPNVHVFFLHIMILLQSLFEIA